MRPSHAIRLLLICMASVLLLTSCGTESGKFRLEGRLRNLNQGEFYIYNPQGEPRGIDTIAVRDGRFAYERELHEAVTLIIVFPNYSQQAVFAAPGVKATIKGDATHLKELTVKGSPDNEQLTALRQQLNRLLPPEIPQAVAEHIRQHPQSTVSTYLLYHYFLLTPQPDYQRADTLLTLMLNADEQQTKGHRPQSEHGQLLRLRKQMDGLKNIRPDAPLPHFSTVDIDGHKVTHSQLSRQLNVITTWATWNYQSTDLQRRLRRLSKTYPQDLGLMSICLDGRPDDCRQRVRRDSLLWPTICDGRLFDTPVLRQLGLTTVPAALLVDHRGRVVARLSDPAKVEEEINKRLQKAH